MSIDKTSFNGDKPSDLSDYVNSITSQYGEDGIIEEIFNRLEVENGFCVEFGAWDGKHLSNAWNLWYNKGWDAILIEADQKKCQELEESTKDLDNVVSIQAFVSPDGESTLDNILKSKSTIPYDFDLLSIDIDGLDYAVWEAVHDYKPKVVIVEYNPTFPVHLDFFSTKENPYFGSSAKALTRLAEEKGYELVFCTLTNLFFVEKNIWTRLGLKKKNLEELHPGERITYLITSYTGQAYLYNPICSERAFPPFVRSKYLGGVLRQLNTQGIVPPDGSWHILMVSGNLIKSFSYFIKPISWIYTTKQMVVRLVTRLLQK